jgi:TATA-box binding protein (TBP) (component of TFIID and TFIIIB)
MNINLDLFHQNIPYLNYSFPKKKRGRKKQDEEVVIVPNKLDYFPIGSIIALQNKQDLKGELPKKKQNDPEKKSFFRNSVTIQMKINHGKFVNGKICSNGKFQITGCSENRYAYEFIYILYEKMIEISKQIGEDIVVIVKNNVFTTDFPTAIINVVMKNINFKIGFRIHREKLDEYIRTQTPFYSLFLSDLHTCVNIKMKSNHHSEEKLDMVIMRSLKDVTIQLIDFSLYSMYYDYNKKLNKDKYHTFLVFYSGSVILSSSGPDTEDVYNQFMQIIQQNKELFNDQSNYDEKVVLSKQDMTF